MEYVFEASDSQQMNKWLRLIRSHMRTELVTSRGQDKYFEIRFWCIE